MIEIVTTPSRWFLRGFLVGVLVCGALNAISYFVRSDGLGNLLGTHNDRREALGFPLELWEKGDSYGGYFVDYPALLLNVACAVLVACLAGGVVVLMRARLNRLVEQFSGDEPAERSNLQFSLRGLLVTTGLIAILAAAWRQLLASRPEVLAGVYLLGPSLLVTIALLPRRIPWSQRVLVLLAAAAVMIIGAVTTGRLLKHPLEIDEVLMGVFVCWTPQSALAALALTVWIVFSFRYEAANAVSAKR